MNNNLGENCSAPEGLDVYPEMEHEKVIEKQLIDFKRFLTKSGDINAMASGNKISFYNSGKIGTLEISNCGEQKLAEIAQLLNRGEKNQKNNVYVRVENDYLCFDFMGRDIIFLKVANVIIGERKIEFGRSSY